jgi:hypothetical protein
MSTYDSVVRAASIIRTMIVLMMEAVCTSETSVDIQLRAWQYIPEDSELHVTYIVLQFRPEIHMPTKIIIIIIIIRGSTSPCKEFGRLTPETT